ncbi:MAG: response regulator [Leptospirales bacterium]|nr:response regulator [Leptospirales bacterium]
MPRILIAIVGIVLGFLVPFPIWTDTPLREAPAILLKDGDVYSATGHLDVAREVSGSVSTPRDMDPLFRTLEGQAPSYGFTSDAYWARITLRTDVQTDWYVVLSASRLNDVRFYAPGAGGFKVIETGTKFVFSQRPYQSRSFVFPVRLQPGVTTTFYLRVASSTSVQIPIRIWQPEAFRQFENDETLIFGVVLGAHLLLLLYNLAIGTFLRSPAFFYYSGLVFVAMIFYATTYGYAYQYLWPNHPVFALYINGLALGGVAYLGAQFSRSAMGTEIWPRIDLTLRGISYLTLASPLLFLVLPYVVVLRIMVPLAVLTFAPILFATLYGIWHKAPAAGYFFGAMVSYAIGSLTYALAASGVLPIVPITQFGFIIGATVAVTIMSIALASQVRLLRIDREAAIAANRFKSKFLSIMSHEIRTPLTAIVGMAQLLTDDLTPDEKATYTRVLRESGDRLSHLVNQVLDFSRIEEERIVLEHSPFALGEILSSLTHLFRPSALAKGLSITLDNQVGDRRFLGDAARLSQVLMNLTANAVKFTNKGGIVIRALPVDNGDSKNIAVRFTVEDTGIGIDPDKRNMIFESFVQADPGVTRRHGGSGLGLAIAAGIVKLMGGQIEVQGNPGGGTIFSFTASLEPLPDVRLEASLPDPGKPRLRILVAEDDEINRLLVVRILEQAGHSVQTAENGIEALKLMETQEFDLALVDLQMPEMDGYSAVRHSRKLQSRNGTIPMYALSANALPSDLAACHSAGFTGHIAKPYRREDLIEIVHLAGVGKPTIADFQNRMQ